MLAVFLGGPRDGQEIEVEPLEVIVFPADLPPFSMLPPPDGRAELVAIPPHHVYRRSSSARLGAIRKMYRTPSFIKVQLSDAPLLYEYEGQNG